MFIRLCLLVAASSSFFLAHAQASYAVETTQVVADNPKMLAQVKRVAITQFVVQFLDRQNNQAVSSSFRGGAKASASLTLAGPGASQYQRIADALYDDVVQTVKAAGVEVISHDQLVAHPEYAVGRVPGKPSPQEDEKFNAWG
ncbi:MAG: hypothetical protein IPG16_09140 [Comamonadaceae bacterium]|nr:hypothetical protein [Comamonadaceae bacterium]